MLDEGAKSAVVHVKIEDIARQSRGACNENNSLFLKNVRLVVHEVGAETVRVLVEVMGLVKELVGPLVLVRKPVRCVKPCVPENSESRRRRPKVDPTCGAWCHGVHSEHQFCANGGRGASSHGVRLLVVHVVILKLPVRRHVNDDKRMKRVRENDGENCILERTIEAIRRHLIGCDVGGHLGDHGAALHKRGKDARAPDKGGMFAPECIKILGMARQRVIRVELERGYRGRCNHWRFCLLFDHRLAEGAVVCQ
mmetsp:Transcript_62455/g.52978  ORF Transcript_62455/g.52978 Transcript_62455/m.52978 type:complete len:253 (-) Transcript_62455:49-807(-)